MQSKTFNKIYDSVLFIGFLCMMWVFASIGFLCMMWVFASIAIFFIGKVENLIWKDDILKPMITSSISWSQDEEIIKSLKKQKMHGLAVVNLEAGVCTIYAEMPRSALDTKRLEVLGHEVMHCFVGDFHK